MKEQRYIAITGASSRIGLSAAKLFAKRGKSLVIISRRQDRLEEIKNDILSQFPNIDIIIKSVDIRFTQNIINLWNQLDNIFIESLINNAGIGMYQNVNEYALEKSEDLIQTNINAVSILSILYVKKYSNQDNTQLINISSARGYAMVPSSVLYNASKFFIGAFTEGLDAELRSTGAKMRAKVLAPALTRTEFGSLANNVVEYDYSKRQSHSAEEVASFLIDLYDSDKTVGIVDRKSFRFYLRDAIFPQS